MFERFTDRARKAMALANQEAQRFNHEYIGTEHILLGLVKEGSGVAANVLKNLQVDLRKIRLEVEKLIEPGRDSVASTHQLSRTQRAQYVIEMALHEADEMGHHYVGTEHLLIGLTRERDGIAAQVIMNLGLTLESIRREAMLLIGVTSSPPKAASEKSGETRRLYLIKHDGESYWVEAGKLSDAVEIWRKNAEAEEGDEPDSIALIHEGGVLR